MTQAMLSNYAPGGKAVLFTDPTGNRFYFSYITLIAFKKKHHPLVIRENEWSQTTGSHLNAINPDHSVRVSGREFRSTYSKQFD
jgi:hypothetical protein